MTGKPAPKTPNWYTRKPPWWRVLYVWQRHFYRSGLTAHCVARITDQPIRRLTQQLLNEPTTNVNSCGQVRAPVWNVIGIRGVGHKALEAVEAQCHLVRRYPQAAGFSKGRPLTTTGLEPREEEILRAAAAGTFFPQ